MTNTSNEPSKNPPEGTVKLNAKKLRDLDESGLPTQPLRRFPIFLILDNVYDTYNIGGLFRLADALAIEKLYICGNSETPPNHKIKKASIGTYKIVPWEYCTTTALAIQKLRKERPDIRIGAIEQSENSIDYRKAASTLPYAYIVGNETHGVSEEVLALCDEVLEIPMYGVNVSLNVIISAAVVMYHSHSKHFPLDIKPKNQV